MTQGGAATASRHISSQLWPLLWIVATPVVTVPLTLWATHAAIETGRCAQLNVWFYGASCETWLVLLSLAPGFLNLAPILWLRSDDLKTRCAAVAATILGSLRLIIPAAAVLASWPRTDITWFVFPPSPNGEVVYGVSASLWLLSLGALITRLARAPRLFGLTAIVAVLVMVAISTAMILSDVRSNPPSPPSVTMDELRKRPLGIPDTCMLTPPTAFGAETVYGSDTYNVRIFNVRTNVFHAAFFNRVMFHMVEHEDALLRGRQIGGDGVVWFDAQGNSYTDRSVAKSTDGTTRYFADEYDFTQGGNTVFTTLWVDAPGCYVLQSDSARGAQKIVIAFR